MAVSEEFLREMLALLEPIGEIRSRPMFGGRGLFHQGKMFAKISPDNVLAFKGDDAAQKTYAIANMKRSGRMPYFEVTADQIEDANIILDLAKLAIDAAHS